MHTSGPRRTGPTIGIVSLAAADRDQGDIKLVAGKHRGGIMVAKLIEGWK